MTAPTAIIQLADCNIALCSASPGGKVIGGGREGATNDSSIANGRESRGTLVVFLAR